MIYTQVPEWGTMDHRFENAMDPEERLEYGRAGVLSAVRERKWELRVHATLSPSTVR